jgi:seryl-tRNA synthetase
MSHGLMPCTTPPVNGNAFRENLKVAKMNKEVFDELKTKMGDLTLELRTMMETHKKEIEKRCDEMQTEIKSFVKKMSQEHDEHMKQVFDEMDRQNDQIAQIENAEKEYIDKILKLLMNALKNIFISQKRNKTTIPQEMHVKRSTKNSKKRFQMLRVS